MRSGMPYRAAAASISPEWIDGLTPTMSAKPPAKRNSRGAPPPIRNGSDLRGGVDVSGEPTERRSAPRGGPPGCPRGNSSGPGRARSCVTPAHLVDPWGSRNSRNRSASNPHRCRPRARPPDSWSIVASSPANTAGCLKSQSSTRARRHAAAVVTAGRTRHRGDRTDSLVQMVRTSRRSIRGPPTPGSCRPRYGHRGVLSDLHCEPERLRSWTKPTGTAPEGGESDTRLARLTRGERPHRLFRQPIGAVTHGRGEPRAGRSAKPRNPRGFPNANSGVPKTTMRGSAQPSPPR